MDTAVHHDPRHAVGLAADAAAGWGYRPFLDGLRAVAVYLVVGFHAGVGRLVGGFIGVDVFFVLSGYLVTNVLLRDLAGGRVQFGRFYARRARRLLPAACVVLLATAVTWSYLAGQVEVVEARRGLRSAALYVSNWYFISEATSYFGSVDASPVAHFWSLSVEEQFYLMWPVLLTALFWLAARFGRHRDLAMRVMVGALGMASAALALALSGSRLDRAYFGTDTRAYQLLAGALLALTPGAVRQVRRRFPVAVLAGSAGFLLLVLLAAATDQFTVNPVQRGVLTTVVTLGLVVALEAAPTAFVARLLSTAPLVYLGKVSYGTYLWHWLVTVVMERELSLSDPVTAVVVAVVATGLASVSYQLLEAPVRLTPRLDRFRWPVVAAGLAASVVLAVVLVPNVDSRVPSGTAAVAALEGADGRVSAELREVLESLTPVPPDLSHEEVFLDVSIVEMECVDRSAEDCIVVEGSGPKVLLMGDSNAHMMLPGFMQLAEEHDFTLIDATRSGCAWQAEVIRNLGQDAFERCQRLRPDTYSRVIPELDPDVVVVMNIELDFGPADADGPVYEEDETRESLELLARPGRTIVILEPLPRDRPGGFNPAECLQTATFVEQCRYREHAPVSRSEVMLRTAAAARDDVITVDLDHLACPMLPVCDAMVGDVVVWRDTAHLTGTHVVDIAPRLWDLLLAAGIPGLGPAVAVGGPGGD